MALISKTNPKKILFVQHAGAGGAIISLSQILSKLDSRRYEPIVLLLNETIKAKEILESTGCKVITDGSLSQDRHVVGGWDTLKPFHVFLRLRSLLFSHASKRRFRAILKDFEPDLVYLNALPVHRYACVAHELKIPVILHVREIMLNSYLGHFRKRYRKGIESCVSLIIYIGPYEKESLGAGVRNEIIPNYVDLSKWHHNENSLRSNLPTILFVGGLNEIKGIHVLLSALAHLKHKLVPFRCVFLGIDQNSDQRNFLKKLLLPAGKAMTWTQLQEVIKKEDLIGQCEFKSFITDPVLYYNEADIIVFPSTEPHFARPLVEAGAMKLPVVASDLPGPRDIVEHNVNGFLVPPNDPAALADALQQLIISPALRTQMGQANYQIVASRFNAAINEHRILDLIDELAGGEET